MSTRELDELRKALERLRDALTEAVRVLDSAKAKKSPSASTANYAALDEPFGEGERGRRLWDAFGQFTTRN